MKNAKSDLVAFLDVDDLWHPQKLELQLELHENPNVHVTYTNYFTFDLSTGIINDYREFPPLLSFKSFLSHNPIPISTSMIKKSLWQQINFDEKTPHIEDRIWAQEIINNFYYLNFAKHKEVSFLGWKLRKLIQRIIFKFEKKI